MNKKLNLAKQIIGMLVLVALVWLVVRACGSEKEPTRFEIEDSPMRVELIRNIAHLATISYEDEVVIDSVEYYRNAGEQLAGNFEKLTDPDNFKHGLKASNVKRRLTLIVKGKIHYGFDLKDKTFQFRESDSLIEIQLPQPKILEVISTPSTTRIFQENGKWQDYEINLLKKRSRNKIIARFLELKLEDQAKNNLKRIILSLMPKGKKVKVNFM